MSTPCDHRRSLWILGGYWMWCYRCGAIAPTSKKPRERWEKPVGPTGENPAMRGRPKWSTA